MNILIVDELCYPQLGGQQVRFKELAEQWVLQGYSVTIVAIDHTGKEKSVDIINRVNYKRIISDKNYYKNGMFGRKISTIFSFCFKLRTVYSERQWDIIIFNQFPMFPIIFYKLFHSKKRTITALDFVEYRTSKLWMILNKLIIRSADNVVCISNYVMKCVLQFKPKNTFVIPSLVDTVGKNSIGKDYYLFMGRMEPHKHPEDAIKSLLLYNSIKKEQKELHFLGGGALYNSLKEKYKIEKTIYFYGNVSEDEKNKILSKARMLILPSQREGLPKVVIECLAYGIPTLTTDYETNGTKYFVEEEGIGVVAKPSIESIADAIKVIESNYDSLEKKCLLIRNEYDLLFNSKKYIRQLIK